MTEKELISKLQELKQIKPSKSWALSVKMSILDTPAVQANPMSQPTGRWAFSDSVKFLYQRKMAYAFAALLLVIAGLTSVMNYTIPKPATVAQNQVNGSKQSASALAAEAALKNSVEAFKMKSQNLAQTIKYNPKNAPVAIQEIKDAAKHLTDAIQKNPQLAKTVALDINNSNKTYLDVLAGSARDEVKQDVSDTLEKTLVKQLIEDARNESLTPDRKAVVDMAETLEAKGDYANALVNMLVLENGSKPSDSKEDNKATPSPTDSPDNNNVNAHN